MKLYQPLVLCCCVCICIFFCGCLGPAGTVPTLEPTPVPTITTPFPTPTPVPTTIPPATTPTPVPTMVIENISVNWAGYAVETTFADPQDQAIDAVEAVWTVPAVDCSMAQTDYAAAFWIGIDGVSSRSVEQIGTDSDCVAGFASYFAWYEMFPKNAVLLDITINPHDEVHTRIEYTGNNTFQFSIRNVANGQNVTVTDTSRFARRNSAEWIAEAPTNRRRILPLARFGPVEFTRAAVTVNGVTGPIADPLWEFQKITMQSPDGLIKANPSDLRDFGTSFQIFWVHS